MKPKSRNLSIHREDTYCAKLAHVLWSKQTQGARTLLVAPGLTTRNKKLLVTSASLLGARTPLVAPGLTTRNKKLLVTSASLLGARTPLVAPGLTTRNKKLLGAKASLLVTKGITSSFLPTRNKDAALEQEAFVIRFSLLSPGLQSGRQVLLARRSRPYTTWKPRKSRKSQTERQRPFLMCSKGKRIWQKDKQLREKSRKNAWVLPLQPHLFCCVNRNNPLASCVVLFGRRPNV